MKKLLCLPISFLLLSSFTNRKASTTSFDGKAYNSKEKMDFTSATDEEIKSYAVPFSDLSGRTAGSLGLTVPLFRLSVETEKLIYGNLRECAQWLFEQSKKHGLSVENWRNYGN